MKSAFGQWLAAALLFCTVPVLRSAAAEPEYIPLLDAGPHRGVVAMRKCA